MPERDAPVLALDILPMSERHHTGIANVAKFLARALLADDQVEGRFFAGRTEIDRDLTQQLVELDDGEILDWVRRRCPRNIASSVDFERRCAGIFTGAKAQRRLFPCEVQIIHDITTIVTPQYHDKSAVQFWNRQLLRDVMTSDLVVAVSQSTLDDLHVYLPQTKRIPATIAHLASCVADPPQRIAGTFKKPYVLVLGTLEPRKNVGFIMECLASRPEWLSRATFVFVGRWGWGESVPALVERLGLGPATKRGDIVFAGFVEDRTRDLLIANATLAIYVPRYEGFGLPVIEALHCGTAVLTSYSSSLPEVGGDHAEYCDFESADSFFDALKRTWAKETGPGAVELHRERQNYARAFSWNETYKKIKSAVLERI